MSIRQLAVSALLIAGVGAGILAMDRAADAQTTTFTYVPAANTRDNIATEIENIRLVRGVPDGTVSCRGNRGPTRPVLRCDIRFVETIQVNGVEISERGNPANVWTSRVKPFVQAEDETAYLLLVDRSDPRRAETVRRSTRDLAEIFRSVGPRQQIAVAAFDNKIEYLQDFTSDGAAVQAALDKIRAAGTTTELYRLSLEAVQRLAQVRAPRKVLVIVSDGKFEDTAYRHSQVVREAMQQNVRIVTIGYYERSNEQRDLQSLRRLSAETRGFYVETPGAQRSLTQRARTDFQARLLAGVIVEAEAPARNLPAAVQVVLRHPQGATTTFTATLMPGVASPNLNGQDPTTPMGDDYSGYFYQLLSWFTEDLTRIAAAAILLAILLFGLLITGIVRRSTRRKKTPVAAARPAPAPSPFAVPPAASPAPAASPRIVPDDPPTLAKPAEPAPTPSPSADPPTLASPPSQPEGPGTTKPIAPMAAAPAPAPEAPAAPAATKPVTPPPSRPAAPVTVLREAPALAWLEFNGEPGLVAVRKDRVTIGRESDNDIVTDAEELTVSRHHAVLSLNAEARFQIVNRSKDYRDEINPILINGTAQETAVLSDGDVIKLGTGNYGFLFRDARGSTIPRRA
jgi:hypothetical protein